MMNSRIIVTIITLSLIIPLINGCGKEEPSGHGSMGQGGGGGDMNFEQQALKMEQDDLAKLKRGAMRGQDFAKIHAGVPDAHNPNEVIAVVNGENIIRLELDRIFNKIKNRIGSSRRYKAEKGILKDLVTQTLLKQFIKKQDIHVSQDLIAEELKEFRENLKENPDTKDKSLEQVMEEQGGSVEELRVALDISLSIDEYLDKTVTEEERKEYFTKNIGVFNGETVTASHIFLNTRNERDEAKLKEAKEKAEKIKAELDNGADFAELAEKNSDCPSAKSSGKLGTFGRSEMVKEFMDVAFATEVNSISDPVKTPFGYHIIKVTDKQKGKDIKYEEIKENVKISIFNIKTVDLIKELTESANIKMLLKETPQAGGGHGSSYSGSGHGGSFGGGGPHWNVSGGGAPPAHGDMSKSSSPHGQTNKGEGNEKFTLQ